MWRLLPPLRSNRLADKMADKKSKARIVRARNLLILDWSHPPGLNWRPADYESAALPTELGWLGLFLYNIPFPPCSTCALRHRSQPGGPRLLPLPRPEPLLRSTG